LADGEASSSAGAAGEFFSMCVSSR